MCLIVASNARTFTRRDRERFSIAAKPCAAKATPFIHNPNSVARARLAQHGHARVAARAVPARKLRFLSRESSRQRLLSGAGLRSRSRSLLLRPGASTPLRSSTHPRAGVLHPIAWAMTQRMRTRTAGHRHGGGGASAPLPLSRFLLFSFVLALIAGLVIAAAGLLI